MNPAAASPRPFVQQPWIRVSDQERDSVVQLLHDAYADGRLDDKELDVRVDQTLAARTYAELHSPLRDLVPQARPQPRVQQYRAPASASTGERVAAMIVHWSGYFTFFLAPLIVYLAEGRSNSYLKDQAAQAANFQVTVLLATVVAGVASFLIIPILLIPVIWVAWLVLVLTGGIAAAAGTSFRYPLTLRIFG